MLLSRFASVSSGASAATHWDWTIRNTSNTSQAINVELSFADFQDIAGQEKHGRIYH
eukprot:COSAG02_NODE_36873_length_449_cov_1.017143_2_plen_56_part_01